MSILYEGSIDDIPDKVDIRLAPSESHYVIIPETIMLDGEMCAYKEILLSYLQLRSNRIDEVLFCPKSFLEWIGKDTSRYLMHTNVKKMISDFHDIGIIEYLDCSKDDKNFLQWNANIHLKINIDRYSNKNTLDSGDTRKYGVVYYDELKRIVEYREPGADKQYAGNYSVVKVLSYLRMCIGRRGKNSKHIEAYSNYYCVLAETLGLSENKFSKCVNILRELGIIHTKIRPNMKFNGKIRKGITIFTNFYKRGDGKVLASGREYYEAEQSKKIALLKEMGNKNKAK